MGMTTPLPQMRKQRVRKSNGWEPHGQDVLEAFHPKPLVLPSASLWFNILSIQEEKILTQLSGTYLIARRSLWI